MALSIQIKFASIKLIIPAESCFTNLVFAKLPNICINIHESLYINFYICGLPRVRVWSFTQLTRMIVAQSQHGNDQSTQVNFVHSSSPLHDLLATPTSTAVNTTLNKSRSFQVWNTCTCSGLGVGHLKDAMPTAYTQC